MPSGMKRQKERKIDCEGRDRKRKIGNNKERERERERRREMSEIHSK